MKEFSSLVKAILFSNIKVGKIKNIKRRFIFSYIITFIAYLGFGIVYSLSVYSNLLAFNREGYDYLNNVYLDNIFAVTTLISVLFSIILIYSFVIHNKTEIFLPYPIKGNTLFFAKMIAASISCFSILFFPLLMNSFIIAQVKNVTELSLYSYFSSTIFSLIEFVFYLFLFSLIIVFIDSKLHLSTNKIFYYLTMLIISLLAAASFIYLISISSMNLDNTGIDKIDSFLNTFRFLSFFGILHKEAMFLSTSYSYSIMPITIVLLVIIIIVLNYYSKHHYHDVLIYPNNELKLFKKNNNKKYEFEKEKYEIKENINIKEDSIDSNKNDINLSGEKAKQKKRFKYINKYELKREFFLLFPLTVISFFTSFISLTSIIVFVMLGTNGIFSIVNTEESIRYLITSYALLSAIYHPSLAYNAFAIEGSNIYFFMTIPNNKINLFKTKFLILNLMYVPFTIIIAVIIPWLYQLDIGMYFVYIILGLSYLFTTNAMNYFIGLIKPNFNFSKNDIMSQKSYFILSEICTFFLPLIHLLLSLLIFIPNLEFLKYILPIVSSAIYILLGVLFLDFGKEQYEKLMNGGKNL